MVPGWRPIRWPDEENPDAVGLTAVEAVDDNTVKFVFNQQPGLAVWPHGIGVNGPIMPAHVWADAVEEARASDDPAASLYGAVGTGVDVSGGPMVFAERQEGAFARNVANDNYYDKGREISLDHLVETGEANVIYTVGPYAERVDLLALWRAGCGGVGPGGG